MHFSMGSSDLKSATTPKALIASPERSSASSKMPALRGGGGSAWNSDRSRPAYSAVLLVLAAEPVRVAGDTAERRPPPSCSSVPCSSAPPDGKAISSCPPWRLFQPPLGGGDGAGFANVRNHIWDQVKDRNFAAGFGVAS